MEIDTTYDTDETTGQLLERITEGPATVEDLWLLVIVRGMDASILDYLSRLAVREDRPKLGHLVTGLRRWEARQIAKTC